MNRERVAIPKITLDRSTAQPLYRQLRDQLAASIRSCRIPRGSMLPSSRFLSGLLGVSRNTILAAYDDLVAEGLVDTKPGSGLWVANAGQAPSFDVQDLLRAAHYSTRFVRFVDPDETPIELRF
jgi:GntR family transcriptional regulator / MocR family aminotransferase